MKSKKDYKIWYAVPKVNEEGKEVEPEEGFTKEYISAEAIAKDGKALGSQEKWPF